MIRVGAEVKQVIFLIGKITPKGESDPTPEEKLLEQSLVIKLVMLKMLH